MIVKNRDGDILLDLIRCEEREWKSYNPTHALIVVKYEGKDLLLFNKWRKNWEVAGGILEPHETLRACAIRELEEETNQKVSDVRFVGMMKLQLHPDNRIEFGGLYAAEIDAIRAFEENEEAAEIVFWNKEADIGYINEIDKKLLDYWL